VAQAWSLLKTLHQQQSHFSDFVAERFPSIELYSPRYKRLSRPHGRRRPIAVVALCFPGYIFARIDLAAGDASRLTTTPFKVHWIKFANRIEVVPDRVVDGMRALEARNELMRETEIDNPLKPGRRVRVNLPIASIDGLIVKLMNGHAALVDTALGHVTAPIRLVEPI
jgi:hypothetical protein